MGEGNKRKASQEGTPAPPSHRILTSDELGLLKVTEVPHGNKWEATAAKQRWGQPDKQQGVARLQVYCPDQDPAHCLVAAARASGRVTIHSPADGVELGSFRAAAPPSTSGRTDTSSNELQGLKFAVAEGQHRLLLVTGTSGGHVAVHRGPPAPAGGSEGANDGGAAAADGTSSSVPVVQTWEEAVRLQTIGDLQAMDVSTSGRHVAVGGDGHQLKVWDLTTATSAAAAAANGGGSGTATAVSEPLFAGKAGKPSRSGLQDLAHLTAVSYIPGKDDQQILVGTAKHKLWLYDMRAGRKPQSELVWGEGRITALLPLPDGQRVWVGNGRGQIEALDLRQAPSKISMGHALKGSAGSIRSLSVHPSEPLIASVSLDRHLRVHHTSKRGLLTKVYLKQALTGVAWLPVDSSTGAGDGEAAAEEAPEEGTGRKGQGEAARGGRESRGGRHKSGKSQKRRKQDKGAPGGGDDQDDS